jgi:hypothetical protein
MDNKSRKNFIIFIWINNFQQNLSTIKSKENSDSKQISLLWFPPFKTKIKYTSRNSKDMLAEIVECTV